MRYFVGVDWASLAHAVCVIDEDGQIVMRVAVDHTSEGLNKLVEALIYYSPDSSLGATNPWPM